VRVDAPQFARRQHKGGLRGVGLRMPERWNTRAENSLNFSIV
jgi:hypothetical protein